MHNAQQLQITPNKLQLQYFNYNYNYNWPVSAYDL